MPILILVAIAASGGAGVVHIDAALDHSDTASLVALFSLTALAQIGWAVWMSTRPRRAVLLTGLVVNFAALAAWVLSRTTGLPVDALADPQTVSLQDGIAAALAAAAIGAIVVSVIRPTPVVRASVALTGFVGVAVVAMTIPALATAHRHDHGHEHVVASTHVHGSGGGRGARDDGHDHRGDTTEAHDDTHSTGLVGVPTEHEHTAEVAASGASDSAAHQHSAAALDDHVHDSVVPGDAGHDHGALPAPAHHEHGAPPATGAPLAGPVVSVDDPRLTPEQRAAAQDLIERTTAGMVAYPTIDAVEGAGYEWIGDGQRPGGYAHFVNWSYLEDGAELDAGRIEAIVARIEPDGARTVVSAMYILEPGTGLADVPDIAGPLARWHDHQNLCWDGRKLAGRLVDGRCQPGGELRVTPPMLHVWLVPHPCGPFAGIDGHGTGCEHAH